ncbi:putative membrane protein [Haloactinopolyspora alba]|uniref:Putative membrane protein n=1 Tax=Haloactinopolyspora alba TaxID=648780 RepID=A0A2P8DPT0_9ACTN|nr:PH domain-containing protein [Haloactinopolyspora alba]PSK99201.1 putative membrane protein [Haloactinopolyspora alba]
MSAPGPRPNAGEPNGGGADAGAAVWQRLDVRLIWVDVAQSLLSLVPAAVALVVFRVEPSWGTLGPVAVIGVVGTVGAVADMLRWTFTRYRVTPDRVERRTGVVVRRHRSVRRDRIRSVDATAKLRHRVAGLRIVNIGAGQQSSAGESAFVLDAVRRPEAERLRGALLRTRLGDAPAAPSGATGESVAATETSTAVRPDGAGGVPVEVFARLKPSWVVYNVFNAWAYLMALGLTWGGYWTASMFGLDAAGFVGGLADWDAIGVAWTVVIAVLVVGAVGVVGLAANFFVENWNFELARVPGDDGTLLRTRKGLFTTREVNRDDNRMRGLQISEPVLWRWMGMADTNVVTTGLNLWSLYEPTAILPRGPITVARRVAGRVLGVDPSPLEAPLTRHPRAALRRRLWWATSTAAAVTGVLAWLWLTGVVPAWTLWAGAGLWPLGLLGALVAYRALGHTVAGSYLVVRSGLMSRSTVALRRSAVSTIAIRESWLQRRLGLKTVTAMTSAGWGAYRAGDVAAEDAVAFAADAAPGLLEPFLDRPDPVPGPRRQQAASSP